MRWAGIVTLLMGLSFFLWWYHHPSAQASSGALRIGTLNIPLLMQGVRGMAEMRRTYEEQRRAYLHLLNLRRSYIMLTGLEWVDLRRLMSKPNRSPSEEAALKRLRQIELEREAELQRLQMMPPDELTPQERIRLQWLTKLWKEGRKDIDRIRQLMEEALRQVEEKLDQMINERLRRVIVKVATEEGLDLVLDKSAVFFVRGKMVDITGEVLRRLRGDIGASLKGERGAKK